MLDPYFRGVGSLVEEIEVSDPPTRAERRATIAALVETSLPHRHAIALLNRFTTTSALSTAEQT